MEVGRQFYDSLSCPALKTYDDTSRQAMRVTQFSIRYPGLVVSHTDGHRLTGQIPRAVSLNVHRRCHANEK